MLQAIVLGIVQGLTEFLPVSSSGHLVVLEHWFTLEAESPEMVFFDLMLHLGTVVAIVIYYRRSMARYFSHLGRSLGGLGAPVTLYQRSASIRFTVLAAVAIVTTGVVYVLFDDVIAHGFEKPAVVASCWLVTAGLLWVTDRKRRARRGLRDFGILAALCVGLAQGAAMFPGISRSGSTICVAVLLGLHRRWAGEFSFLIGVPTIMGAALLKAMEFFGDGAFRPDWAPTLVGSFVSAAVGVGALWLLLWALRRAHLKVFAVYCALAAVATFIAVSIGKI